MASGYPSSKGINASAQFHCTAIEEVLPGDDRKEVPEGTDLVVVDGAHEVVSGGAERFGVGDLRVEPAVPPGAHYVGDSRLTGAEVLRHIALAQAQFGPRLTERVALPTTSRTTSTARPTCSSVSVGWHRKHSDVSPGSGRT